MKKLEEGLKAGLIQQTSHAGKRGARASRSASLGKTQNQKLKTGSNCEQGINSLADAVLWFVANQ